MNRATLAATCHRRLRALATDANLSPAANGLQTEGDYTDAIDAALRALGMVHPETGELDISTAPIEQHNALIEATTREMLTQLQLHYAALTDIKIGDREEKLSQIRSAIAAVANDNTSSNTSSIGGRKVEQRRLTRRADDYEFN